jgi:N-acetylglucosamine-6-phosphate deacetylase
MLTALTAAELYTPVERIRDAVLVVEDGLVRAVGSRSATEIPRNAHVDDYGENVLAPGFVDIHIHGAAGHDVMEGTDAALEAVERKLVQHGVTSYVPTTVTAPLDPTLRALEHLANAIESGDGDPARARPLGVHLEGPFISHERRGVHPPAELRAPSLELFERMWQASRGHVLVMTIAPELPAPTSSFLKRQSVVWRAASDTPTRRPGLRARASQPARVMRPIRSTPCVHWIIVIPGFWEWC